MGQTDRRTYVRTDDRYIGHAPHAQRASPKLARNVLLVCTVDVLFSFIHGFQFVLLLDFIIQLYVCIFFSGRLLVPWVCLDVQSDICRLFQLFLLFIVCLK